MTATALSPAETQTLTHRVNQELASLSGKFQDTFPLRALTAVLADNDLDVSAVQDKLRGDKGRIPSVEVGLIPSVEVGLGVFLSLSWERFESGRYEFNAYVSSEHDDYRAPYTRQMNKSERRKARTGLMNVLVDVVGKTYYEGLAAGFGAIQDALIAAGFDYYEFEDATTAGRLQPLQTRLNVSIGQGLYLSVSWYRMPSGRYEITACAS